MNSQHRFELGNMHGCGFVGPVAAAGKTHRVTSFDLLSGESTGPATQDQFGKLAAQVPTVESALQGMIPRLCTNTLISTDC